MRRAFGSMLISAATLALAGCDKPAATQPPAPALVAVPDSVQAMMAERFPADGEIHAKSLGRITIKPDTPVCEIWLALPEERRANHFGVNSSDLFLPLGQSDNNDSGSDRQQGANIEQCPDPDSVIILGLKSASSIGQPYKLVLAVWQGDPAKGGAAWVSGVVRIPGNLHSAAAKIRSFEGERISVFEKLDRSVEGDVRDLSNALVAQLTEAESSGE